MGIEVPKMKKLTKQVFSSMDQHPVAGLCQENIKQKLKPLQLTFKFSVFEMVLIRAFSGANVNFDLDKAPTKCTQNDHTSTGTSGRTSNSLYTGFLPSFA